MNTSDDLVNEIENALYSVADWYVDRAERLAALAGVARWAIKFIVGSRERRGWQSRARAIWLLLHASLNERDELIQALTQMHTTPNSVK